MEVIIESVDAADSAPQLSIGIKTSNSFTTISLYYRVLEVNHFG